ncbi:hypothetical protein OFB61_25590, partial [Escherichia coli]|nr:hypothetical protein [Escherichia coli]
RGGGCTRTASVFSFSLFFFFSLHDLEPKVTLKEKKIGRERERARESVTNLIMSHFGRPTDSSLVVCLA